MSRQRVAPGETRQPHQHGMLLAHVRLALFRTPSRKNNLERKAWIRKAKSSFDHTTIFEKCTSQGEVADRDESTGILTIAGW
jgi:hypothetical protein